jgi:hypothetical protein
MILYVIAYAQYDRNSRRRECANDLRTTELPYNCLSLCSCSQLRKRTLSMVPHLWDTLYFAPVQILHSTDRIYFTFNRNYSMIDVGRWLGRAAHRIVIFPPTAVVLCSFGGALARVPVNTGNTFTNLTSSRLCASRRAVR